MAVFVDYGAFRRIEAEVELLIALLRQKLDFEPPVPVEFVAGLLGLRCEFQSLPQDGEKRKSGTLFVEAKTIVVDRACHKYEYVFTVAHEIGHWVLHVDDTSHPKRQTKCNREKRERLRDWEANLFARALLIPQSLLFPAVAKYRVIDAAAILELARVFGVSPTVMRLRLEYLTPFRDWTGPRLDRPSVENLAEHLENARQSCKTGAAADAFSFGVAQRINFPPSIRQLGEYLHQRRQRQGPEERKIPMIIEFAGTPKAGKDTLLEILRDYLQDVHAYKVGVVEEGIRRSRIDRTDSQDFVRLTQSLAEVVKQLHEARFENAGNCDFVLVNRGLLDRAAFVHAEQVRGRIDEEQERILVEYLLTHAHFEDLVLLFLISPEEAIRRENRCRRDYVCAMARELDGVQPKDPRVINERALAVLNRSYEYIYRRYRALFRDAQLFEGDCVDIQERAFQLRKAILREEPVQLRMPGGFDACYQRISALPERKKRPRTKALQPRQLSFLDEIAVPS
jgi:Zn-dependent peptidase ImmA (M78 family)